PPGRLREEPRDEDLQYCERANHRLSINASPCHRGCQYGSVYMRELALLSQILVVASVERRSNWAAISVNTRIMESGVARRSTRSFLEPVCLFRLLGVGSKSRGMA